MVFIVIGGAGYIGSHMIRELLELERVVCIDQFSNSFPDVFADLSLEKKSRLTVQREYEYNGGEKVSAIFHFAALKSVPESIENPLKYYENNLTSCIQALKLLEFTGCDTFIYSSSACVYAPTVSGVYSENDRLQPTNPYGHTKLMCETMICDTAVNHPLKRFFLLRYFNPYGGVENPRNPGKNLIPAIKRAIDMGTPVTVYESPSAYNTVDNTCIRDFIHIDDLIQGHLVCYKSSLKPGVYTYNLGTGQGAAVMTVVNAYKSLYPSLSVKISPPRPGDPSVVIANCEKIGKELGWHARTKTFRVERFLQ